MRRPDHMALASGAARGLSQLLHHAIGPRAGARRLGAWVRCSRRAVASAGGGELPQRDAFAARPPPPQQHQGAPTQRGLPLRVTAVDTAQPSAAGGAAAVAGGGGGSSAPTFQEAITRLQAYWADKGCAVWLPHNTEASAAQGGGREMGRAGRAGARAPPKHLVAAAPTCPPPPCCPRDSRAARWVLAP